MEWGCLCKKGVLWNRTKEHSGLRFAGQAVSAATNPKLFIVKVLVTILAVLIGFLFVVGSLFGVIFSQLGFSNSADYTSEMFQIETET